MIDEIDIATELIFGLIMIIFGVGLGTIITDLYDIQLIYSVIGGILTTWILIMLLKYNPFGQ